LKLRNRHLIWPVYLDARKTRREGRKVPKALAVESPQLAELERACASLNLNPEVKAGAHYPRYRLGQGYIAVDKAEPKLNMLKKVASKVCEGRR